jgi:hypothetical protein
MLASSNILPVEVVNLFPKFARTSPADETAARMSCATAKRGVPPIIAAQAKTQIPHCCPLTMLRARDRPASCLVQTLGRIQ